MAIDMGFNSSEVNATFHETQVVSGEVDANVTFPTTQDVSITNEEVVIIDYSHQKCHEG